MSFAPDDKSWSIEGDYPNVTNGDNITDVSKVNVFNMAGDEPLPAAGNTPSGNRLSAVMTGGTFFFYLLSSYLLMYELFL